MEYNIDGVCQVQISDKTGLTFANVLRSVLRQDPDIIAVGTSRRQSSAMGEKLVSRMAASSRSSDRA